MSVLKGYVFIIFVVTVFLVCLAVLALGSGNTGAFNQLIDVIPRTILLLVFLIPLIQFKVERIMSNIRVLGHVKIGGVLQAGEGRHAVWVDCCKRDSEYTAFRVGG